MAKAAARDASTAEQSAAQVSNGAKTRAPRSGNGTAKAPDPDRALGQLEQALTKAANGDFKVRLPAKTDDAMGRVEAAYNELAARNAALEAELKPLVGGSIVARMFRYDTDPAHNPQPPASNQRQ